MNSSWIPTWVAMAWTLVFIVVMVVHIRHMITLTGRTRVWHATHILMALGMIAMFWPSGSMFVAASAGEVVFSTAVLLVLAVAAADLVCEGIPAWLWLIAVIDLGSMVYMFAMTSIRYEALTVVLAVWCVAESAGWATGRLLDPLLVFAGTPITTPGLTSAPNHAGDQPTSHARRDEPRGRGPGQHTGHTKDLRITLTLMGLGMAYMLLAMQYGMPAMGSMTHTSGT